MITPNDPSRVDADLEGAIRTWLAPGPRTLSQPEVERVLAAVRATHQLPAWRAGRSWSRLVAASRLVVAAAAVVALVGVGALATGRMTPPRTGIAAASPAGSGAGITEASASPAAAPLPAVTSASLDGTVAATGATWKVRYPQVGGLADAAVQEAINASLLAYAQSAVRRFSDGDGATRPVDGQAPSELQVDYTVAYRSPSLLSLRLLTYDYTSGAAHGGTALTTFTLDLATGRQLALGDLFRPGAAYLEVLSVEARDQLRTDPGVMSTGADTQWLTTGTAPTPEDFAGWAVTEGGLEVTFGEYQVAPYAAGMPAVTVPFAHLADVLDPAGPLGPLVDVPLPTVTVTLGLYSGRPDPTWTLSDVQTARIIGLLTSLPTTSGTPPQGGLGYRGFTFVLHRTGAPDATYTAYTGAVAADGDTTGTYLDDPGRTVEAELLADGRAHLTPAEVAAVETALATP